jgi:hypothetical protein
MAVTYEQARELVRAATEPGWPFGTYCLDDRTIVENDDMYVFSVGAREYIVDGDISYAVAGNIPVVRKSTGELVWLPSPQVGMDETLTDRPNPHPTMRV